MTELPFSVVHFNEMGEVECIPSSWLLENGKKCMWPPFRNPGKLRRAIRLLQTPASDWETYSVRLLKSCGKYYI